MQTTPATGNPAGPSCLPVNMKLRQVVTSLFVEYGWYAISEQLGDRYCYRCDWQGKKSGWDSAGKRLILETLLKWLTKELATTVIKTLFSASSVTFSLSEFLTSPIRVSIITWIHRIKILLLKVKETRWDILYPQGRLGNHRCKLQLEKMISLSNILKVN